MERQALGNIVISSRHNLMRMAQQGFSITYSGYGYLGKSSGYGASKFKLVVVMVATSLA